MVMLRCVIATLSAGLMVLHASSGWGQDFPNKRIRILTAEAGGGSDFVTRVIAQGLTANLGQQVIVENRGGAGGAIAAETVAKAPADGYTLLLYGSGIWVLPLLRSRVPYDPVADFAPITLAVSTPNILVVHPSLQVRTVKELIGLAKARPKELNYSVGGIGGSTHLAAELFKAMAGVSIVQINYKGTGAALNDLIAGQVHLMFPNAAAAAPHVKSGRLRALAVTSAQASVLTPDLPTVAASGVPGYESLLMFGVLAPAKTPATLVRRLNEEILRVLKTPDVREKLFNVGVEIVGSSPDELAVAMKSEIARLGKVIRDAGIRDE